MFLPSLPFSLSLKLRIMSSGKDLKKIAARKVGLHSHLQGIVVAHTFPNDNTQGFSIPSSSWIAFDYLRVKLE